MRPPPSEIGGLPVIRWSPIDGRHHRVGACRRVVAGQGADAPAAVAICVDAASGGYLLFGCDADWHVMTDTWHESLEQACAQAEFEFPGVTSTWM
jgi:hypothetical protein